MHSTLQLGLPSLDQSLDQVVNSAYKVIKPPQVLYHYTKWENAKNILSSQRFWARAHYCMEDKAELVSANKVIVNVAKDLRSDATGAGAQALDSFISGYSESQIAKRITVCLACFSLARDDKEQWENYGDKGRGVCLGIRVLDEPGPGNQPSALIEVDYSEASWRDNLKKHFGSVCSLLFGIEVSQKNCDLGLSALNRIAAKASIGAKQEQFKKENEFRYVTLVTPDSGIQLSERGPIGERKRYLEVSLRNAGKRIAFDEIIIGSKQGKPDDLKSQLESLLTKTGYKVGDFEYPKLAFDKPNKIVSAP